MSLRQARPFPTNYSTALSTTSVRIDPIGRVRHGNTEAVRGEIDSLQNLSAASCQALVAATSSRHRRRTGGPAGPKASARAAPVHRRTSLSMWTRRCKMTTRPAEPFEKHTGPFTWKARGDVDLREDHTRHAKSLRRCTWLRAFRVSGP